MLDIGTGLAALKTAADLTKTVRDAVKSKQIKPDELSADIGQIYDHIIDSKAALVDANEELQKLRDEIRSLKEKDQLAEALQFDGHVYWLQGDDFPYCPLCWGVNKKLVRLQMIETNRYSGVLKTTYHCSIHNTNYYTPTNADKHDG